jgi:hypothetical protein
MGSLFKALAQQNSLLTILLLLTRYYPSLFEMEMILILYPFGKQTKSDFKSQKTFKNGQNVLLVKT